MEKYIAIYPRQYARTRQVHGFYCGTFWGLSYLGQKEPYRFYPDDWENSNEMYSAWKHGEWLTSASIADYPGVDWLEKNPTKARGGCGNWLCTPYSIEQDFESCFIGEKRDFGKRVFELIGCVKLGWKCTMSYVFESDGSIREGGDGCWCTSSCKKTFYGDGKVAPSAASSHIDIFDILELPFRATFKKANRAD